MDVLLQLIECHGSVLSCAALRSDEEVQSLARRGASGVQAARSSEAMAIASLWQVESLFVLIVFLLARCNIERTLTEGAIELREARTVRCRVRENAHERSMALQCGPRRIPKS